MFTGSVTSLWMLRSQIVNKETQTSQYSWGYQIFFFCSLCCTMILTLWAEKKKKKHIVWFMTKTSVSTISGVQPICKCHFLIISCLSTGMHFMHCWTLRCVRQHATRPAWNYFQDTYIVHPIMYCSSVCAAVSRATNSLLFLRYIHTSYCQKMLIHRCHLKNNSAYSFLESKNVKFKFHIKILLSPWEPAKRDLLIFSYTLSICTLFGLVDVWGLEVCLHVGAPEVWYCPVKLWPGC